MGSTGVLPILCIPERRMGVKGYDRISAMAELAEPCECIADIGCDHGYIGLALLKKGKCRQAIECDISAESIKKAQENFQTQDELENASFRVCDGLDFSEEVQGIVIAGMGAQSIAGILVRGKEKAKRMQFLILQPATDAELLRQTLIENGFYIDREWIVQEGGRFYPIVLARPGREPKPYRQAELLLGRFALHRDRETLRAYIAWKSRVVGKVLSMPAKTDKARAAQRRAKKTMALYQEYWKELEGEQIDAKGF